MVITDGEPSDDHEWDQATKACRAAESSGKCVIYPIGVSGANVAKLQMVSATQALILDQVRFVELFKWLSKSVTAITNSTPGQSVQLPSTDAWVAVKA